jgi:hypothetical protein
VVVVVPTSLDAQVAQVVPVVVPRALRLGTLVRRLLELSTLVAAVVVPVGLLGLSLVVVVAQEVRV